MNLLEYQKGLEKRQIKPINLIHGEDEYVIRVFMDKISTLYKLEVLWGDELDRRTLLSRLTEEEMFEKRDRVVFIKRADDFLKTIKDGTYFTSLEKKLRRTKLFLIVLQKLSKQTFEKEPFKSLSILCDVLEAKSPDKKKVRDLVEGKFQKEGIKIEQGAVDYLLEMASYNLMLLKGEVDKLVLYGKKEITLEDVKRLCVLSVEHSVFDLMEAFFTKDLESSLFLLESLYRSGMVALQIQAVLINYALKLFVSKKLVGKGLSKEEALRKVGIRHPYQIHTFKLYMEKLSMGDLSKLISNLYWLDISEKLYSADPEKSLRNLVIEYMTDA
ncbi:MAG: DNA polymerase III subunit delta [Aquificaceae bacterium]